MRTLTLIVALAGALYSGWWFLARSGAERAAAAAIDRARAEGWTVDYTTLAIAGFPNRLDTTLHDLRLADPEGRIDLTLPELQVAMLSYAPNRAILTFPDRGEAVLDGRSYALEGTGVRASVAVAPRPDLPLREARAEGEGLSVVPAEGGAPLTLDGLMVAFRAAEAAASYEAFAELLGLTLPAAPQGLPARVERLRLDARLAFDRPIDRRLRRAPALVAVVLREATAVWGPVRLAASGSLTVDAEGLPEGRLSLALSGWEEAIAAAAAAGRIPAGQGDGWVRAFALLADAEGELRLPLSFAGGLMLLGPVPIGPAPRLSFD